MDFIYPLIQYVALGYVGRCFPELAAFGRLFPPPINLGLMVYHLAVPLHQEAPAGLARLGLKMRARVEADTAGP
ncbi:MULTISPECIES: hypothetical protein [Bradyrhizobium]|uniref:Uncharacterized protein n=1 Tax=Bradyrhizobium cajani TaxID=1928661 RepID=A0A844TFH4_9BRAD|nr:MULTISPECIES: hypothetical protein [Bradyrhizobium]MCP3367734.1 hypothetical protein [Bradyrhizobium cajani]MVT73781.1 hypothetical protein [Bradyrhizobium cajani]